MGTNGSWGIPGAGRGMKAERRRKAREARRAARRARKTFRKNRHGRGDSHPMMSPPAGF